MGIFPNINIGSIYDKHQPRRYIMWFKFILGWLIALALTLAILFIFVPFADAFQLKFKNDTDKTLIYYLNWVDHNFKNHFGPVSMAVGELKPGATSDMELDYKGRIYFIIWRGIHYGDNKKFEKYIPLNNVPLKSMVIVTPNKATIFGGA